MSHAHEYDEADWPFGVPVNTAAFTTRQILEGGLPILDVYHDHQGEWQFLCRTTYATDDLKIVCLGCMIDRDSSLLELAQMPIGWCGYRASPAEPWIRAEYEEDSDND